MQDYNCLISTFFKMVIYVISKWAAKHGGVTTDFILSRKQLSASQGACNILAILSKEWKIRL